jgi:transcription elongation factor Elf1
MASESASLLSLTPPSAIAPELVGFATCPSCHTVDANMTNVAVNEGAEWHCGRCGQRWDALRLATVAAYAVWLSGRQSSSHDRSIPARGDA